MGDLAHGKCFAIQLMAIGDHDAFKDLNALFVTLHDFGVDANGIAWPELGERGALLYGDALEVGALLLFRLRLTASIFIVRPDLFGAFHLGALDFKYGLRSQSHRLPHAFRYRDPFHLRS